MVFSIRWLFTKGVDFFCAPRNNMQDASKIRVKNFFMAEIKSFAGLNFNF
jgi:hypothetical protein